MNGISLFPLLLLLAGCIPENEIDVQEARSIADREISSYCKSASNECAGIVFIDAVNSDRLWEFEYQTNRYSYVVLVGKNRRAEISRMERGE